MHSGCCWCDGRGAARYARGGTGSDVDRVYRGGTAGNTSDDPLSRLLPVGNQGGFRTHGRPVQDTVKLVVLYTSGAEPDWPDALDPYTGTFTYFGDNRSPGRDLHNTPRKGNLLLAAAYSQHSGPMPSAPSIPGPPPHPPSQT
jgi:hypothetical protein